MERHQVDGKRIDLIPEGNLRLVDEVIELGKSIYKLPNPIIIRVKDMRAINVNIDAFHLFSVTITAQVGTLVNDKNTFTGIQHGSSKSRSEHA
jgi:hypothetical protein